ncbi:MAG: hypothetical protein Q7R70_03975 [Candidatus Diapherotrites archaeon]|nr:hypothetical protein [Candidatus Diapherotrites archaeon]
MIGSFATAISESDCSRFNDWKLEECQKIFQDSSLNTEQQQDLFFNLSNEQGELGSFSSVFEWNKNLSFTQPPRSITPASNGIIQNAWVKVISVENSFFDLNSNEWFAKPAGQEFSNYGFSIVLPSSTQSWDCQTNYSYDSLSESLQTFLNNQLLGNSKDVSYNITSKDYGTLNFETRLSLSARLRTDHYKLTQHRFYDYYWTTCDFDNTEYQTDSVNIIDSFNAKTVIENFKTELLLEDSNNLKTLTILLDSNAPINNFKLSSNTGSFEFSEANFDLNSDLDGVLFVTRRSEFTEHVNGFLELDSNFSQSSRKIRLGTTSLENCQQTITSSFEQNTQECNIKTLKRAVLQFDTDLNVLKLSDNAGNPLPFKTINVSAGSKSSTLITDSQGQVPIDFNSQESNGLITASFQDSEFYGAATLRTAQIDNQSLNILIGAFGFLAAYFFIFLIARHAFRKVF